MLEEIEKKYSDFGDSLIMQITFQLPLDLNSEIDKVEITIRCLNLLKGSSMEIIKLIFEDILLFNFSQVKRFPILIIDSLYYGVDESGIITFDFFPIDYGDYTKENPDSYLIVKSKKVSYELIEEKE